MTTIGAEPQTAASNAQGETLASLAPDVPSERSVGLGDWELFAATEPQPAGACIYLSDHSSVIKYQHEAGAFYVVWLNDGAPYAALQEALSEVRRNADYCNLHFLGASTEVAGSTELVWFASC